MEPTPSEASFLPNPVRSHILKLSPQEITDDWGNRPAVGITKADFKLGFLVFHWADTERLWIVQY
jgi:hypothetical protein